MRKVVGGAVTAAALALTPASATATAVRAESIIQAENAFCGSGQPGLKTIGVAELSRSRNVVKVTFKLTAGDPSQAYTIELWAVAAGEGCGEIGEAPTSFKTNRKGVGGGHAKFTVNPADDEFFAAVHDPAYFFDESLAVRLP